MLPLIIMATCGAAGAVAGVVSTCAAKEQDKQAVKRYEKVNTELINSRDKLQQRYYELADRSKQQINELNLKLVESEMEKDVVYLALELYQELMGLREDIDIHPSFDVLVEFHKAIVLTNYVLKQLDRRLVPVNQDYFSRTLTRIDDRDNLSKEQLFNFIAVLMNPKQDTVISLLGEAQNQIFAQPAIQVEESQTNSLIEEKEIFSQPTLQIKESSKSQVQYFIENLCNDGNDGNDTILYMNYIPGGSFMMGTSIEELLIYTKDRSIPQHMVEIKPFFMGKFQVTQAQWTAVASLPKVNLDLDLFPSMRKGKGLPVEYVSWYDAVEFCARLSQYTEREYRLPSEAEWEYACRAGTTSLFNFGENIDDELVNYSYKEGKTTRVGIFPPNAFGLYDMHGNVWEWCADTWHDNYKDAPTDGSAWCSGGDDDFSPLRGGSYSNNLGECRSTSRLKPFWGRGLHTNDVGFRVVCDVSGI